ncbi:MAG: ParB/RepB/Spo0J family partition protein [Candidatus Omnitrophica bacterium]|nr:ParB/RepB/Spo0J family partition protein [Candidatus Omnitrophota bacterium]
MTRRLGRGLADIIESTPQSAASFVMLRTDQIRPGRFQPRASISEQGLEELKASIKRSGIIEPIIVRPIAHGTYEVVAGERRFRASQAIGIKEVPSIIKTISDKEALEYSLVENIQRENLNPMEEAKGYERLLDEFGYTQEDIASAVGKDRATVANALRLLALPEEIQLGLREGAITAGHAKALLSLEDRTRQLELYRQASGGKLSVRQTEAIAGALVPGKRRRARRVDPQLRPLEDELRRALSTKVSLFARKKGGRIVIEYFSQEDLTRILHAFGVST